MTELNPKTKYFEFLGPPGAFLISVGVPIATYTLYFACSESTGGCPPSFSAQLVFQALTSLHWWKGLWDTEAAVAYLAWYAFCVIAWAVLPGDQVTGTQLRNGGRKTYRINGTTLTL
jgi:delta14-sterol reductase